MTVPVVVPNGFLLAVIRLLRVNALLLAPNDGSDGEVTTAFEVVSGGEQFISISRDWHASVATAGNRCLVPCHWDGCSGLKTRLEKTMNSTHRQALPGNVVVLLPRSDLPSIATGFCLRLDSLVVSYSPSEDGSAIDVSEHYALGCGQVQSKPLFRWSPTKQPESLEDLWTRRSDLDNVMLKAAVVIKSPNVYINEKGAYDGYMIEILHLLQEALHFQVEYVIPPDGVFGVYNDGSWTGIMRELVQEDVNMSAAAMVMSTEREEAIDFSLAAKDGIITVLKAVDSDNAAGKLNFLAYVKIFDLSAWIGLAVICLLTSACVLASLMTMGARNFWAALICGFDSTFMSLIQQTSDFQHVCAQEADGQPLANRMLFVITNLCFLMVFAFYTSDLTAAMTAGVPEDKIHSFQDILDAGLTVAYKEGSVDESFLALANRSSPMGQVYLRHSQSISRFEDMDEIIRNSGGRVLGYDTHGYYLRREKRIRPILSFGDAIRTQDCYGFPKGSELVGAFNHHLLSLHQSGMIRQLHHNWFAERSPPDLSKQIFDAVEALPLGHLNLVFPDIILCLGIFASMVLCLLEKCT